MLTCVSGPLLGQKAEESLEKMGKVNFKATERWGFTGGKKTIYTK